MMQSVLLCWIFILCLCWQCGGVYHNALLFNRQSLGRVWRSTTHKLHTQVPIILGEAIDPEIELKTTTIADDRNNSAVNRSTPIDQLLSKYSNKRLIVLKSPLCDQHDIYLCGTMHIAQASIDMVKDVINATQPHCIMIEMCEERLDGLLECNPENQNLTLPSIFVSAFRNRSLKALGVGILTWMQAKAASLAGGRLGGEIVLAAKEAHRLGAWLVLGDRKYSITIQRAFDHLTLREKLKLGVLMMVEMMMLSWTKVKDYLVKSEEDEEFIHDEVEFFSKSLPKFAEVLINERDEYLAQSMLEISRFIYLNKDIPQVTHLDTNRNLTDRKSEDRKKIVAIVGVGHLRGIQRKLQLGGSSIERLHSISSSSRHFSTWPGSAKFMMVNTAALYNDGQIL